MRVLHVVHALPPFEMTGTPILTWQLARAQAQAGASVHLFARLDDPRFEPGGQHDEVREGCRIRWFHERDIPWKPLELSYRNERAEQAFAAFLAEVEPEVIHIQHLLGLGIGILDLARAAGVPVVLSLHDFWLQCPMGQRTCRTDDALCDPIDFRKCDACVYGPAKDQTSQQGFLAAYARAKHDRQGQAWRRPRALADALRSAFQRDATAAEAQAPFLARYAAFRERVAALDLVIGTSDFICEEFRKGFGLVPDKVLFLANGMDFDSVQVLPKRKSERLRFGFVGSIMRTKGVGILVEAFLEAAAQRKDIELHIHGSANRWNQDFEQSLKAKTEASGLRDRVHWHGGFEHARIGQVHQGLDWLVVPSIWFENSPLVLNEAAMTGTPVLASDRGGMEEFVRVTGWGRTFRLGDPKALAAALIAAATDAAEGGERPRPPAIKPIALSAAQVLGIYEGLKTGEWVTPTRGHQLKTRGGILADAQLEALDP